jgi:hypothetical protein
MQPDELNPLKIQQFDESMQLLDYTREKLLQGEIMSLLIISELTSGDMEGSTTATENVFGVAGYMMAWAMRRMGFTQFRDVRKMISMEDEK